MDSRDISSRRCSSYSDKLSELVTPSHFSLPESFAELDLAHTQAKLSPNAAVLVAKEIGPRVYTLLNHNSNTLRFFVFGCQGDPGEAQNKVAELMNKLIADHPEQKPDFIIILGDNVYPDGVKTPNDERFQSQFHDVYGNPKLNNICGIPCFVILGNHDGNRHRWEKFKANRTRPMWQFAKDYFYLPIDTSPPPTGEAAEINQIAHTLLSHPDDPEIRESKLQVYTRNILDLKKLQRWNMPYFFYSTIVGKVQIFYLNSNTYVKDFLELLKRTLNGEKVDVTSNQAAWVAAEYVKAKLEGRAVMFAQHHPLFTCGKRSYRGDWDADLYLSHEEIKLINRILELSPDSPDFFEKLKRIFAGLDEEVSKKETNGNYNVMLTKIYQLFQKMYPEVVFAAHDHSIYFYNNIGDTGPGRNLCQVISGGGGGELMDRRYFSENKNLGCFFNNNGFFMISCDKNNPNTITIEPFTTEGNHLIFTNHGSLALRGREMDPLVEKVRKSVLEACDDYLNFLDKQQNYYNGKFFSPLNNLTHSSRDVDHMHQIEAFLYEPHPASFDTTILTLYKHASQVANKASDHSLYKGINDRLKLIPELNGKGLDELHTEISARESNAVTVALK